MRKAYVEIWCESDDARRKMGHKFEENKRINLAKMLQEYTTDIFGERPAVFKEGEKTVFAFETDDGENVTIYTGDLRKFQDKGLMGLERASLSEDQVATLKQLL